MSRVSSLLRGGPKPPRVKRLYSRMFENEVLRQMLREGIAVDQQGEQTKVKNQILIKHAEALFRTVLELRPKRAVEVGMACGAATLSILSALERIGGEGSLVSIDPNQTTDWKGVGVTSVARAGLAQRHRFIEDYDYFALPRLLAEGEQYEFAYIDGWHTFDYTLLDLFYIDRMLAVGGIVGFNDCGWPAVHKVIRFLLCHRRYEEISVSLPRTFVARQSVNQFVRKRLLQDRAVDQLRIQEQDRYFRKLEAWEPKWNFFAEF
jgi:predicted O-methyltransferase YrrM